MNLNFNLENHINFNALAENIVKTAVLRVADEVRNQILINLTGRILKIRTGNLRRTWSTFPKLHEDADGPYATLQSNLVYAAIHEFGGEIKPVKAKALVFTIGSQTIVTKKVVMPARRYLSISIEQVEPRAPRIVEMAAKKELKTAGML